MTSNQDRERWLIDLAKAMEPEFERLAGVTIPAYAVTCGFPSKGGELGKKTRVRGQCWAPIASEAKRSEIFISPVEDDPRIIAAILAHELVHACHPEAGHKGKFVATAKRLGHVKPFTTASDETVTNMMAWAQRLIDGLPPYPHKRLNALACVGAKKKQSARLLKAECGCGYTVRVTKKWVDLMGPPHCPVHGPMSVDGYEPEDGEGDDE